MAGLRLPVPTDHYLHKRPPKGAPLTRTGKECKSLVGARRSSPVVKYYHTSTQLEKLARRESSDIPERSKSGRKADVEHRVYEPVFLTSSAGSRCAADVTSSFTTPEPDDRHTPVNGSGLDEEISTILHEATTALHSPGKAYARRPDEVPWPSKAEKWGGGMQREQDRRRGDRWRQAHTVDLSGHQPPLRRLHTKSPAFQDADMMVLKLGRNCLTALPARIGLFDKLEDLDLRSNRLTTLPDALARLQSLRYLNISRNEFSQFPGVLLDLAALVGLALCQNHELEEIPRELFEQLQILAFCRNTEAGKTVRCAACAVKKSSAASLPLI